MADAKVSALDLVDLADVTATDLLYFVDLDEVAEADRSKKITIDRLFDFSYIDAYAAGTPAAGDFLVFSDIDDSDLQKKVTLNDLFDYVWLNTYDAATPAAGDFLVFADINDSNLQKKVTLDGFFDYKFITAFAEKTTLVPDDEFVIADSESSDVNKKIRFSTIVSEMLSRNPIFHDEMWNGLRPEWSAWTTTGSGAPATSGTNGHYRLTTGAGDDNEESRYWGDTLPFLNTLRPQFEIALTLEQITVMACEFGLWESSGGGGNDYIKVAFDTDVDGNWNITASNGGSTTTDAGAAATTDYVRIVVKWTSDTAIEWYINGASQGTVSSNVPTVALQPFMRVYTREASAHYVDFDYFSIWQERS